MKANVVQLYVLRMYARLSGRRARYIPIHYLVGCFELSNTIAAPADLLGDLLRMTQAPCFWRDFNHYRAIICVSSRCLNPAITREFEPYRKSLSRSIVEKDPFWKRVPGTEVRARIGELMDLMLED